MTSLQQLQYQYPVALPPTSITFGKTFLRCPIYLLHLCTSTVLQNSFIPSTSSSLLFGLTTRRMYSLSSCHRFSIGFISGDSGGVFHQLIPFASIQSLAYPEVCFGSLSCINLWWGMMSLMNGRRVLSRMSTNSSLTRVP